MRIFKRKLNKRGEAEGSGLGDFVHIIFSLMLVVLLGVIVFGIFKAFFSGGVDRNSKANFESLAQNVHFMIDKDFSSFEQTSMIFFLKDSYMVYGFMGPETLSIYGESPAEYPSKCKNKPCLCLYKNMKKFPRKPVDCVPYDSSVVFHGYDEREAKDRELYKKGSTRQSGVKYFPQDPALYSDYPPLLQYKYEYLILSFTPKEGYNLYIDKFVKEGRTHILLAGNLPEDLVHKRSSLLAICPSESEEKCISKTRNSKIDSNGYCHFDELQSKCVYKENVMNCIANQKITTPCLCGTTLINPNDYSTDVSCVLKDGVFQFLPFLCEPIMNCIDYCKVITSTKGCDPREQDYCEENPCSIKTSFSKKCRLRPDELVTPNMNCVWG